MTTFLVEIIKPSQYGPAAYAFIGLESINPDNLFAGVTVEPPRMSREEWHRTYLDAWNWPIDGAISTRRPNCRQNKKGYREVGN